MHIKIFTKTVSMGVNKAILNLNHNIMHKSMLLLANKIQMLRSHLKVGIMSVEMKWPLTFQDIFPLSPYWYVLLEANCRNHEDRFQIEILVEQHIVFSKL